ncbi:isochorismate synthase [Zeaxanthinibacter enoshimensis]|uniref:isochorismate synthase n=1 Tax=Zeaxanthinibacter enoshimensis TaxID=392009 RepID=UPI0035622051
MDSLLKLLEDRLRNDLPFVVYRLPGEDTLVYMAGKVEQLTSHQAVIPPGFLMAPFDSNETSWFMYAEEYRWENLAAPVTPEVSAEMIPRLLRPDDRQQHEQKVSAAVTAIRQGLLKKVVLSRKELTVFEQPLSEVLRNLLNLYPSAFCYWWFHPETKSWMGASPELLLETRGSSFKSVSLAGTQEYLGNLDVKWGDKEREEQQIVTEYIMEQLQPVSRAVSRESATTVRAGRLLHLKTKIRGEMRTEGWQPLVAKLHPTPAVCGYPTEVARKYILEHEGYDREFYTGYLGPVGLEMNPLDHLALFVNLRCMKIDGEQAAVFVGGGITADSVPEKEWEEIEAKSSTMMKVLANSVI